MTHDEAEALRGNVKNWHWGIVYKCQQDPRLIVRNRFVFGWTWNFGHPKVVVGIILTAAFVLGVPYLLAASGIATLSAVLTAFFACLLVVIIIANYIASGPR